MFTKINPVESGYFWGKSWYFNEKSLKDGKSQTHSSFFPLQLYYYWELKGIIFQLEIFTKINLVESGYFFGKTGILMKNR